MSSSKEGKTVVYNKHNLWRIASFHILERYILLCFVYFKKQIAFISIKSISEYHFIREILGIAKYHSRGTLTIMDLHIHFSKGHISGTDVFFSMYNIQVEFFTVTVIFIGKEVTCDD